MMAALDWPINLFLTLAFYEIISAFTRRILFSHEFKDIVGKIIVGIAFLVVASILMTVKYFISKRIGGVLWWNSANTAE
jgi:hypothetical protein